MAMEIQLGIIKAQSAPMPRVPAAQWYNYKVINWSFEDLGLIPSCIDLSFILFPNLYSSIINSIFSTKPILCID